MLRYSDGILEGFLAASVPLLFAAFAFSRPWLRELHLPEFLMGLAALGLFYRTGWDLNREQLVRWQRLFWRFSQRAVELPLADKVILKPRRFVYRGKQSNLVGEDFQLYLGELHLAGLRGFFPARAQGERVARFLQLPLEDQTFDPPKLRRWDELNSSLQLQVTDQLSAIGPGFPVRQPPSHLRARYHHQAHSHLRIDIPNSELPFPWLYTLLLTTGLIFFGWGWLDPRKGFPFEFLGVLVACWAGWKASASFQAEQLAATARGLHFRSQWGLWQTLPWQHIEEIEVEAMKARGHTLGQAGVESVLTVRADQRGFLIGQHLSAEELQ